ncbi:MAG: AbrB/MazE/SpoVT family DNA-binding domain-containing protein [Nitrospirota bacterium]|jgi:AbrB family looped-hinge helix DNA binding protein
MAKVTSKLQLTLPKAIADQHGIRPGDEVAVVSAGEAIRILPARRRAAGDTQRRLALFDQATTRQAERDAVHAGAAPSADRGWTREELYERGGTG